MVVNSPKHVLVCTHLNVFIGDDQWRLWDLCVGVGGH